MPIFPICFLHRSILGDILALTTLLPIAPKAFVQSSIRPPKDTKAIFLISYIMAAVLPTSRPRILPDAMYNRVLPLSLEASAIRGNIHAVAMYDVIRPLAMIHRAISPVVDSIAIFLAFSKQALVSSAFDPSFHSSPILQIITPLPSVGCAALVVVDTKAASHVLCPLTNVDVSICVREAPLAGCTILPPLPFVGSTIWPSLLAIALSHFVVPLACIRRASSELVHGHGFQVQILRLYVSKLFQLSIEISGRFGTFIIRYHAIFKELRLCKLSYIFDGS
mmetsp:Transcript_107350/g.167733  ORF Transcript_107350/g.167733 Transcript_107350/m.167733 type:complete len:279 (-) Transcript_107350:65-901(-)